MTIFLRKIESWTKEECKNEALKYKSRIEFQKKSSNIYNISRINNWLDEICSHMIIIGSKHKRLIYLYKFSDNYVYIGLSGNIQYRDYKHKNNIKSPIYKHIKETGLNPKLILLSDYIDINQAQIKEKYYIIFYKESNYKILNKRKGGELGGNILIWNYDKCKIESEKYKTRKELRANNSGAYRSSLNNNWLNEFYGEIKKHIKIDWNYDKCKNEAIKYNTKGEFDINNPSAYNFAYTHDFLNEICSHMIEKIYSKNYWTKNKCQEVSLNCNSKSDFNKKYCYAYNVSNKNNWLDEFFPKK
jgi:predicted GIY-YIG superfamily endonuclease